jgi:signal transduction histidine kinase/CheY-like chemotaxis protein
MNPLSADLGAEGTPRPSSESPTSLSFDPRVHSSAINEALLVSGLREHELRENAERLADECIRLMDLARLATLAAEKANGAKDVFLATLSHELRTPLNPALLLASEGAQNPELSAEVRRDFAAIEKNILLEARLIDELLDITKIARGKIAMNMDAVSINDVILDAISNVQGEIDARGSRFEFHPLDGNPLVTGDPMRLQQVFWNVLKNAVKFSPAGGEIFLETSIDVVKQRLSLRFVDRGIGIESSELDHIFDPFNQGRLEAKPARAHYGGLGLGLAITKSIVELHSGTIKAESRGRGFGSTFTIELPLRFSKLLPSAPVVKSRWALGMKQDHNSIRVLFVEDDPESRAAVHRLLVARGLNVTSVGTMAEAVRLGTLHSFDLLITDIGLPDGNGLDLLKVLARQSPRIKGIALSGYGSESDRNLSRSSGFAIHLVKPIGIETLEAALYVAIEASSPFLSTFG